VIGVEFVPDVPEHVPNDRLNAEDTKTGPFDPEAFTIETPSSTINVDGVLNDPIARGVPVPLT